MNCYPSNVHISPLGGKFKIWNFLKQHQFLPDVSIFVLKYYFIPTLAISEREMLQYKVHIETLPTQKTIWKIMTEKLISFPTISADKWQIVMKFQMIYLHNKEWSNAWVILLSESWPSFAIVLCIMFSHKKHDWILSISKRLNDIEKFILAMSKQYLILLISSIM